MPVKKKTVVKEPSNLMDTLVAALHSTKAVEVVQDVTVPGCEHFPDRLTVYFKIINDPAWKTYRLRILQDLAALPAPGIRVHIGQQFMFTDMFTKDKKQQVQVNMIEVEGTERAVETFVKIVESSKRGAIDARLPETQVLVGGVAGRVAEVKSERFMPSMTMIGGRGNAQ